MNVQKAVECVLWFIERGESNMYNIWKMLFAAEKYSLNNYGCPITGDEYYAMKHGTVPTMLYDIARSDKKELGFHKEGKEILVADKQYEEGWLSDYDLISLEFGYNEYKGMNFNEVEAKNHKEPCWKKNYATNSSTPIPFEDFIEQSWVLEDLKGIAHRMVL
jgi:uncharacterized phage-associated protein